MYDYDLTSSGVDYSSLLVKLGSILLVVALILLVILIFEIVATCRFFKKSGRSGWEAIVPFYNNWVLVEVAGLNWWWFLLLSASSIVSLIFGEKNTTLITIAIFVAFFGSFVCCYNIAKKYHKETGFAVLMAFFPGIVIPIMAFSSKYQYDGSVPVSKNGPFGSVSESTVNTVETNTIQETVVPTPTVNEASFCPNCGKEIELGSKFCGNCGKEL